MWHAVLTKSILCDTERCNCKPLLRVRRADTALKSKNPGSCCVDFSSAQYLNNFTFSPCSVEIKCLQGCLSPGWSPQCSHKSVPCIMRRKDSSDHTTNSNEPSTPRRKTPGSSLAYRRQYIYTPQKDQITVSLLPPWSGLQTIRPLHQVDQAPQLSQLRQPEAHCHSLRRLTSTGSMSRFVFAKTVSYGCTLVP